MGRIWVLDTDTKGTGAEMVPLEKIERKPDPEPLRRYAPPVRGPVAEPTPQPRAPASFRVIDVLSGRVLSEHAGTRETVELLEDRRSAVDVTIDVWDREAQDWHRLTHGERGALWALRGRSPGGSPE